MKPRSWCSRGCGCRSTRSIHFSTPSFCSRSAALAELIDARVATRKPAAYLLSRAYIQGVPFYVDERVIVPRSFIGELLFSGLVGEGGLIDAPEKVGGVLDLCTGGGSLAILAAREFRAASVDAVICPRKRSKSRKECRRARAW